MSSNTNDSQFLVDKVEYSPKAFYDSFSNHLPRLVQVTRGYYGEEQVETYERGQKLFIRRFGSQERIVATVLKGPRSLTQKKISIPVDYNATFCLFSNKKGGTCKKYKLHRVLSKNNDKLPIDVLFIPDMSPELTGSNWLTSTTEQLVLRLTRRYRDTFLLGHDLRGDRVTSIIQKLPLYLTEMRISLVVGRTGYEKQEWDSYIHNLSEICDTQINCDSYFGNPDIALYDNDSEDFDATVRVPNVYCTLYDCLSETNVYQTLHGLKPDSSRTEEKCDTYDVISNCVREKVPPVIPPKPNIKKPLPSSKEQTAQKTVANVSNEDDVKPFVPQRSDTASKGKVKRHTSTSTKVKSTTHLHDVIEEEVGTTPKSEETTTPKLPPRGGDGIGNNVRSNLCVENARKNVNEMDIKEVGDMLKKLGLEKYVPIFKEKWIDGAILSELSIDILHKECSMSKIEAVRLMSYVQKGHVPR
ncbi:uncharacterized protein LOC133196428 [Saccostrea echinata]|uniref:uncharacterized protein LOC133196428 n=1 Tax=Saccostrea echinata TaxID=191078 RepID=UPI002A7F8F01|nr:uncharacterized protein LOC133196428 [Saccostrea echinata]